MKKWNIISLMLVPVFILGITSQLPGAEDYSNFKGRAISLKVLQRQVKDFQAKGSMPTTLYHLCGITRIHGYMVDEANKDIILIGSIQRDKPPLYLDDFVIAMRNAWMKYTELKGNTNYYSNPGCSIDPDPAVMGKLDEIGNRIKESQSLDQIETVLRQWESVCNAPQKVRVMGIPFNTHFAWVMVKADYDMKRIADGTDELNLLWFSTLADLQMEEAKKQHIHGRATSGNNEGINRFWFYPGEYRFLEDDNAVMIETCKVKLLTEEEHLTSKGDISGTGRPDPVADKFANDFTDFYPEVAAQRPIYQELENLFRFVALAKVMKLKAPHEKVGLSLEYLLEQYPVSEKKVDTSLPGRSNVNRYKRQRESTEGTQVAQLWLPSCGGVSMDVEANQKNIKKEKNDKLENVKACATSGMILEDKLYCDFKADAKEVNIVVKRKLRPTRQNNLKYTLGEIYINGKYFGRTLELPFVWGRNDISSIPVGTYEACLRSRSKPSDPWRIQIPKKINVHNQIGTFERDLIQMHAGAEPKKREDLMGCIEIGPGPQYDQANPDYKIWDYNSSIKQFNTLLEKYFGSSQCPDTNTKITITVKTDYKDDWLKYYRPDLE